MESIHVTFFESYFVINPQLSLTGNEIFSDLEHHHIDTGTQHGHSSVRKNPKLEPEPHDRVMSLHSETQIGSFVFT